MFRSPSRALGPLFSIRLCGKSSEWLLHFYLIDLYALLAEKYYFTRHVVELFTFEDLEITVAFRSTWFHTNPNSNNYWNSSSFHFTRDKLHRYCKNMCWTPRFSLRWSMSDLFQRFDGLGKCSAFIFISNWASLYMQISRKPTLFVGV